MKKIIREQITATLKMQLSGQTAAEDLLVNLKPLLDKASSIAIYHANSYELSLGAVIKYSLAENKQLYQPVCYKSSRQMLLSKYDEDRKEIFSPAEFIPDKLYEWYNLDLILLPLIAVDKLGFRLGKGGGYYDTTLAEILQNPSRPLLCGIGFDLQLVEYVPRDAWDIHLDYFASELRLIKF